MNDISYMTQQQPLSLSLVEQQLLLSCLNSIYLHKVYYKGEAPAPVLAVNVLNIRDPSLSITDKPLEMELATLWIFLLFYHFLILIYFFCVSICDSEHPMFNF